MTREEAIKKAIEDFEWAIHADNRSDISLMDMQLAIAALREQPRWISVEERLPETECLATSMLKFRPSYKECLVGRVYADGLSETGFTCESNGEILGNVTHWMPLPEAPKEEV